MLVRLGFRHFQINLNKNKLFLHCTISCKQESGHCSKKNSTLLPQVVNINHIFFYNVHFIWYYLCKLINALDFFFLMNQVQPLTFTSELILFCYNDKIIQRLNINVIISF